jgi:hypothetical protein
VIPLIPVEEAQLAKLAAEFGLRIVREFPPFPINLAAEGIASAASVGGAKLIAVVSSTNTSDDTAKALEAALSENNICKLY